LSIFVLDSGILNTMVTAREPLISTQMRGLRRDYTPAPKRVTTPYLLGVLHDATERKTTYRIATNSEAFAKLLEAGIKELGMSAWVYREGRNRTMWITEFSKTLLKDTQIRTKQDQIEYLRGYFDSEGGIAKSSTVRYYIYFAQKNKSSLIEIKHYLTELGIKCGKIHNPSRMVDPHYWRFYLSASSYERFARMVGSNHPEKFQYLWMKR
jgi:intein/homing endonuclease